MRVSPARSSSPDMRLQPPAGPRGTWPSLHPGIPGTTMSNELNLGGPIILDRPKQRRSILGYLSMFTALAIAGGGYWAWEKGYISKLIDSGPVFDMRLVEGDQGDVTEYIVEYGSLESASNTVVRCEVEALIGTVGGTSALGGAGGTNRSGTGGTSGSGQGGSGTSASGGQGGQGGTNISGGTGGAQGGGTAKSKSSSKSSSKTKSSSSSKSV